ncbi:OLC1v1004949C1 [Oldenlandia corymbosa var. corymbosa]|uniref:OLC1v1004949C1 n=1 Tax=Oldenlandia corymbosa var. corymbosa TaxID=529605 RepID=A0AAV1DES5_OLDCO|nr:OLC1v1004949C1 [Oldenlandia corymbosa var. corymbosa]
MFNETDNAASMLESDFIHNPNTQSRGDPSFTKATAQIISNVDDNAEGTKVQCREHSGCERERQSPSFEKLPSGEAGIFLNSHDRGETVIGISADDDGQIILNDTEVENIGDNQIQMQDSLGDEREQQLISLNQQQQPKELRLRLLGDQFSSLVEQKSA